jgi:hypothetical protein
MNILDILESLPFLRIILSRAHALGGWKSVSNSYIQICLESLDILKIPAMSAAPERLFSSVNITISDRRNRLHGDTT